MTRLHVPGTLSRWFRNQPDRLKECEVLVRETVLAKVWDKHDIQAELADFKEVIRAADQIEADPSDGNKYIARKGTRTVPFLCFEYCNLFPKTMHD